MGLRDVRRFLSIFREDYAQRVAARKAEEAARDVTVAEAGFWAAWALSVLLTLVDDLVDLEGAVWTAVRLVGAVAWIGFGLVYLTEVVLRRSRDRRSRRLHGPVERASRGHRGADVGRAQGLDHVDDGQPAVDP